MDNWTPEKEAEFLAGLAAGGSVSLACGRAGMSRSSAYWKREREPDFREAWDQAIEAGTDGLEDALHVRARRDDTTAAIFLLKARRPNTYRETIRQEHTGANGDAIRITNLPMTQEAREALLKQLHQERQAMITQQLIEAPNAGRTDPAG